MFQNKIIRMKYEKKKNDRNLKMSFTFMIYLKHVPPSCLWTERSFLVPIILDADIVTWR